MNRPFKITHRTVTSYSKGSKWLHWVVSILVLLILSIGFFLDDFSKNVQPLVYMLHKSMGLTILLLMLVRLFWIIHTGKPALPKTVPRWERVLSRIVQYSLYVLLLIQPLVGWIMSVSADRVPVFFGLFRMPLYGIPVNEALSEFMEESHTLIAWMLVILIALHILGALKHALMDKDKVLQSMLP